MRSRPRLLFAVVLVALVSGWGFNPLNWRGKEANENAMIAPTAVSTSDSKLVESALDESITLDEPILDAEPTAKSGDFTSIRFAPPMIGEPTNIAAEEITKAGAISEPGNQVHSEGIPLPNPDGIASTNTPRKSHWTTLSSADRLSNFIPAGAAPILPKIGTVTPYRITLTTVRLQVSQVTAGGTPTRIVFDYGKTTSYGGQVSLPYTMSANSTKRNVYVDIVGLKPGTLYHFRCRAICTKGTKLGTDAKFTTYPVAGAKTLAATNVTDLNATLNGTLSPGGKTMSYVFKFSLDSDSSTLVACPTSDTSGYQTSVFHQNIWNLKPNTTYRYWLTCSDGEKTYDGGVKTFTTAPAHTPPTIGPVSSTRVLATSAEFLIGGIFIGSSPTTTVMEYGTTASYGSVKTVRSLASSSSSESSYLRGLEPDHLYHYRCVATNSEGVTRTEDGTFTTKPYPVVTTLPAADIRDTRAKLMGSLDRKGLSYRISFEYGETTAYEFGDGDFICEEFDGVAESTIIRLRPDRLYHYRFVATDESGTRFYGQDSSFVTTPPTTLPSLENQVFAVAGATSAKLSFSGLKPGYSIPTIRFEYGPTLDYGSSTAFEPPLNQNFPTYGSTTITGLAPSTTYHYRSRVSNQQGETVTEDRTFTTLPLPELSTLPATDITDLRVKLNGSAKVLFDEFPYDFVFDPPFGSTNSVSAVKVLVSGSESTTMTRNLTSLSSDTTYHFRLRVTYPAGEVYFGEEMSFHTDPPHSPPICGTVVFSFVGSTSVNLGLSSFDPGSSPATVSYEYGTSTNYGTEITSPYVNHVNNFAPNLTPGTTYHFRCKAVNAQGTSYSEDASITTQPAQVYFTHPATNIGVFEAQLNGLTTGFVPGIQMGFSFGPTTNYNNYAPATVNAVTGVVSATATNLLPNTTYHFRLTGTDGAYRKFYGEDQTFTTLQSSTPPSVGTISATNLSASWVTLTALGIFARDSEATVTFEYGPTHAYGISTAASTVTLSPFAESRSVDLTGLTPSTTYYCRCKVQNSSGATYSDEIAFTTSVAFQVETLPAADITDFRATFRGQITPSSAAKDYYFEYGTTPDFGSTSSSYYNNLTSQVAKLLPDTVYYYRLVVGNRSKPHMLAYGSTQSFRTRPGATPPTLGELSYIIIGASGIRVATSYLYSGSSPATLSLEYGLTDSYGSTVNYPTNLPINITQFDLILTAQGLAPGQTYHARYKIVNAEGADYGKDFIFTTLTWPALQTLEPSEVTSTSGVLQGMMENGYQFGAFFQLGLAADEGSSKSTVGRPDNLYLSQQTLQPNTTYFYRIGAIDSLGNNFFGNTITFTTPPLGATTPSPTTPNADGTSEVLRYALALGTSSSVADELPKVSLHDDPQNQNGPCLALSFNRDPQRTDASIFVEAADSLSGPWIVIASSANGAALSGLGSVTETSISSGLKAVLVEDVESTTSKNQRVMRVRVER